MAPSHTVSHGQLWASLIMLGALHTGFMYTHWRFFHGDGPRHFGHVLASHGFAIAAVVALSTFAAVVMPEQEEAGHEIGK